MTCTKIKSHYFIKNSPAAIIKLALVFTCVASIHSLAADEDKTPEEISSNTSAKVEENTQESQPTNNASLKQQSIKKAQRASRFKPSEEISEDYSVPFPVDI
ncbi:MAG: hypothetical protein DRQ64_00600 [Gammaproteobacteria bacterium]|nr:MAG: hypothetical protein DRQ64_00600 [Gammaproteobacteria bacterium]